MNYINRGKMNENKKFYKLNITATENGYIVDDKEQLGDAARYWSFESFDSMSAFLSNNLVYN